ncbi:MAG: class I SAM-dependent methyltransferase, partial [Vicinamibacterales bacterium]
HEASAGSDHPIDEMSRQWALRAARRYLPAGSPVVLEVGSSSGFLLGDLQTAFPHAVLVGSDYLSGPLQRVAARVPGVPLLQFDLVQCPLPDACVDVAILLNVFEHIEDDGAAARQIARVLKPGGVAIVEVPAGPRLFDVYDEYLRHHRRYSAAGVRSLLIGAGLTICEQSHLGFLVYPSFVIVKRRNQQRDLSDPEVNRRIVEANITSTRTSRVLRACLRVEAWFGRYVSYPLGIRVVTVARKPAGGR